MPQKSKKSLKMKVISVIESEGIKDDGDESARESEDEDEDKLMNS